MSSVPFHIVCPSCSCLMSLLLCQCCLLQHMSISCLGCVLHVYTLYLHYIINLHFLYLHRVLLVYFLISNIYSLHSTQLPVLVRCVMLFILCSQSFSWNTVSSKIISFLTKTKFKSWLSEECRERVVWRYINQNIYDVRKTDKLTAQNSDINRDKQFCK